MRMYDPRVGRFFSADPLMFMYPFLTPYQFAGNMPIVAIDLDGAEPKTANGSTLPNGKIEGDSNGSGKKGSVLMGTKIGGVVHKAEVKTRVATENKTGETVARENIPSINAGPLNSPEGNKDVKINEPSAAQEFGDGFQESLYGFMYGIADHGPMYIVDGAVNTFWALGDVYNDGIAYWSTPRSGPETVTYILDDRNYTNTTKSIANASPRGYGHFFGAIAISAASTGWYGSVAPLNGGRYFPARTTPTGLRTPELSITEDVLYGTNKRGSIVSRGTFRRHVIQNGWDEAIDGVNGGKVCPECGIEVKVKPFSGAPRDWHLDHVTPWTKRYFAADVTRAEVIHNYNSGVRLLCPQCNLIKSNH